MFKKILVLLMASLGVIAAVTALNAISLENWIFRYQIGDAVLMCIGVIAIYHKLKQIIFEEK